MADQQNGLNIPYIVYESMLNKEDRQQKRLVIVIILLIVLLVGSNLAWLYAWNQYEYVETDAVELDAGDGGNANYIGRNGRIINGTSESDENEN